MNGNGFGRRGWLALIGGGEFSFEETLDADEAWVEKLPPGPVGFIPAASGSNDYAHHFAEYMGEAFQRQVEVIPIYRARDARRGLNSERIRDVAAVYIGGGVTDHLLDALRDTPATEALATKIRDGGVVVAIAAAAQAAGRLARSIFRGDAIPGFGWLPDAVVEPNFDPAKDRRLRKLLAAAGAPGVNWGLGIPAGNAVLLGPEGVMEVVGTAFRLGAPDAGLEVLGDPDFEIASDEDLEEE
ncbi:MAG TPA: Type 1 glutamine amidotransferase-like domain-containing protein [Thermoanaerobaculia bacterium]|nr:Type 1 glutamine amidotransferase-like domain-containing protein [Thermoanaerobaculia bacterium]